MSNGRTISFYMSHDEIDALTAEAERRGVTRNDLVRALLREGVQRSPTGKAASTPKV